MEAASARSMDTAARTAAVEGALLKASSKAAGTHQAGASVIPSPQDLLMSLPMIPPPMPLSPTPPPPLTLPPTLPAPPRRPTLREISGVPQAVDPAEALPFEVFVYVLSFLRPRRLASARLVSRGWYSAASDGSLYRRVRMPGRIRTHGSPEDIERIALKRIAALADAEHVSVNVEFLDLDAVTVEATVFAGLVSQFPRVVTLRASVLSPTHQSLLPRRLVDLSFAVRADGVMPDLSPLSRLSRLQCLSIRGVHAPHRAIPFGALATLRRLILSDATGLDYEALMEALLGGGRCGARLEALDFAFASGDKGYWWRRLREFPALRELGCHLRVEAEAGDEQADIEAEFVEAVGSLPVRVLHCLAEDRQLAQAVLLRMTSVRSLVHATTFMIEFLPRSLVHVVFLGPALSGDDVEALLRRCPALETLSINRVDVTGVNALVGDAGGRRLTLNVSRGLDDMSSQRLREAGHRVLTSGVYLGVLWRVAGGVEFA